MTGDIYIEGGVIEATELIQLNAAHKLDGLDLNIAVSGSENAGGVIDISTGSSIMIDQDTTLKADERIRLSSQGYIDPDGQNKGGDIRIEGAILGYSNSYAKDIVLDAAKSITVNSNLKGNNLVYIHGGGDLTITDPIHSGEAIILTADGSLTVQGELSGLVNDLVEKVTVSAKKTVVLDASIHAYQDIVVVAATSGTGDICSSINGSLLSDMGNISLTVGGSQGSVDLYGLNLSAPEGTIDIKAGVNSGSIKLDGLKVTAAGAIQMKATGGYIQQRNGLITSGQLLELEVAGNIEVITQIPALSATISKCGLLEVQEMDGLTIDSVTSANGDILITQLAGGLVINELSTLGGKISLQSQGEVRYVGVKTIQATELDITARGSITIDTAASGVAFEVIGSGNIDLLSAAGTTIHSAITDGGTIDLRSEGSLTMEALESLGGAVHLSTLGDGDMTIGLINAGGLTPVWLTSGGSIYSLANGIYSLADGIAPKLIADDLYVNAAGEVTLHTNIETLNLNNAGVGTVRLYEDDSMVLPQVVNENGGIEIHAGWDVDALEIEGDIELDMDLLGSATIKATGDIRVSRLSIGGDSLTLDAGGSITIDKVAESTLPFVEKPDFRTINLNAGTDVFVGNMTLDVGIEGSVSIDAGRDISVDLLDIGAGSLIVDAGGVIVEGQPGDNDVDIVAGLVELVAGLSIGDSNGLNLALETAINNITKAVAACGGGNIFLNENDDIVLGQIQAARFGLTAGGSITTHQLNTNINAQDRITLQAGGMITVNSGQLITSELWASVGSGMSLSTRVENISAQVTGAGNIVIHEADSVTLSEITTEDGVITVSADGTITAVYVESLADAPDRDVFLTSLNGDVLIDLIKVGKTSGRIEIHTPQGSIREMDAYDGDSDLDGYYGYLKSLLSIGSLTNPNLNLECDLTILEVEANDLVLNILGDINLYTDLQGIADITATGTITVTHLTSFGNSVTLNAGQDILIAYLNAGETEGVFTAQAGGDIREVNTHWQ